MGIQMNRIFRKIVSGIITAATVLAAAVVLPPEPGAGLNVSVSAADSLPWGTPGMWKQTSTVIKNTSTVYGSDTYSIKITNTEYNMAYVEKTYKVTPGQRYVMSAYVKVTGFAADPSNQNKSAGAYFTTPGYVPLTKLVNSNQWTKLEWVYMAGEDETIHTFRAGFGNADGLCKGTAYFSGITVAKLDTGKWMADYSYKHSSQYSTDARTVYSGEYSLKIDNTDYDISRLQKTVAVKPDTTYRLSAYVKYSGYKLESGSTDEGGAVLRIYGKDFKDSYYANTASWTKIEVLYHTRTNETSLDLQLYNGMTGRRSKGTAWFSNVRFEEATTSNKWNVLTIFFTKTNGTGTTTNGKKVTVNTSYSTSTVDFYKNVINKLYDDLDKVSGGLVDVRNIDYKTADITLTELIPYDYKDSWGYDVHGLQYDMDTVKVRSEIDRLIGNNVYQQVIAIVPGNDTLPWWGLTGRHNGVTLSIIRTGEEKAIRSSSYPTNTFVHEIAHGLERDTKDLGINIVPLHSMSDYGYKKDWEKNDYEWYKVYYRNQIKGGIGVDPRSYQRVSGYKNTDSDMTPGVGVEDTASAAKTTTTSSGSTSKTDISKAVGKVTIPDKYYSGYAVKPDVTIKGLTKGTDYTLTYKNNDSPGVGKLIITGKGKYSGLVEVSFNIKLRTPSTKVANSRLTCTSVAGADGYELYYSKNGASYKKLTDVKTMNYNLTSLAKGKYDLRVRAYKTVSGSKIYSSWSKAVSVTKK